MLSQLHLFLWLLRLSSVCHATLIHVTSHSSPPIRLPLQVRFDEVLLIRAFLFPQSAQIHSSNAPFTELQNVLLSFSFCLNI